MHVLFYVLGMAVTALAFAGCGPSAEDLCRRALECEGQADDEDDLDDCVEELEELEEEAADAGCEDEYGDYLSCVDDNLECDGDDVEIDGCDDEVDDLGDCFDDDDGGGDTTASGPGCAFGCDGEGNCSCLGGSMDGLTCCDDTITSCDGNACSSMCCS